MINSEYQSCSRCTFATSFPHHIVLLVLNSTNDILIQVSSSRSMLILGHRFGESGQANLVLYRLVSRAVYI